MRILHAIHDFLPRHPAGSEIYASELCKALEALGHETHILCAEYDPSQTHGSLVWRFVDDTPVTELINNWSFENFEQTYRSKDITNTLGHALDAVAPDILHIHNLFNLSFDLPKAAATRGIPSVATLHEFTLVCPSGGQRVHLAEEYVCHEIDPERCARCFRDSPFAMQMAAGTVGATAAPWLASIVGGLRKLAPRAVSGIGRVAARAASHTLSSTDIEKRLQAVVDVYDAVDLFIAPSPALGRDFVRFGLPEDKLEVSDYGFPALIPTTQRHDSPRLRIGFVGTLVWHKGAHIFMEAAALLPRDRFEIHLFGSLDTFPAYVVNLRSAADGLPIEFHGGFDRNEVADVYGTMDVVVISSLWPENSPLVIHEAFMAGVPVVGSNMGGTVDLIEDGVNGLVYEATSATDLARVLSRLIDEPRLLQDLRSCRTPVKTIEQDAQEWVERYRRILGGR